MRKFQWQSVVLGALFGVGLIVSAPRSEAGDSDAVRAALKKMQVAATKGDAPSLEAWIEAAALRDVPKGLREGTVADLRAALTGATVVDVRSKDATAIVVLEHKGRVKDTLELSLLRSAQGWRLDSPYAYATSGKALERSNGSKPAHTQLKLRRTNKTYGATAYSFRYASGDAQACKNRMDIWVCHNDDIHASKDGRLVDVGKKKLSAVKRVPVGSKWARTVPIEKGHVYVMHCKDRRDRDFYVKFRVKSFKRSTVDLEWMLLTGGFGAPVDIHTAEALTDGSGADGCDGLCGKSR